MRRLWRCVRLEALGPRAQAELGREAEAAADRFCSLFRRYDGRELDIARAAYICGWIEGHEAQLQREGKRKPW